MDASPFVQMLLDGNSHSQETLRRVKENDETLKNLWIGEPALEMIMELGDHGGVFNPSYDDSEFSKLGEYVAENTHLTTLSFNVDGRTGLDVECLKSNSSIHKLSLICGQHDISANMTTRETSENEKHTYVSGKNK